MGLPLQWTNTLVWTVLSQQSWIQSFLGRDLASIVATWSTSPGPRMSQFPMRQTQTAHVQTPVWQNVDILPQFIYRQTSPSRKREGLQRGGLEDTRN